MKSLKEIASTFEVTEEELITAIQNENENVRSFKNKIELINWLYDDYTALDMIVFINDLIKNNKEKKIVLNDIYEFIINERDDIFMYEDLYCFIFESFTLEE